jgi:hypothetical protein
VGLPFTLMLYYLYSKHQYLIISYNKTILILYVYYRVVIREINIHLQLLFIFNLATPQQALCIFMYIYIYLFLFLSDSTSVITSMYSSACLGVSSI